MPLLERLKFLAIFESNLDEFFMVRVGGLQQKVQAGIPFGSGADRMPPPVQLERIGQVVRQMTDEAYRCLGNDVLPALETRRNRHPASRRRLAHRGSRPPPRRSFRREIFPVLTPLAIDPGHPFPHLLNKSLNLAVVLRRPRDDEKLFAVVQVPAVLPRFIPLPASAPGPRGERGRGEGEKGATGDAFVPLEAVIRLHLPELFPGMDIEHDTVFRVTRNSEYEIDDDEVEDLLKTIEEEVRKRRRGMAVRLEIEAEAPADIEQFLMKALDLDPADVYPHAGSARPDGPVPDPRPARLSAAARSAVRAAAGAGVRPGPVVLAAIRSRDILMHHPYESFGHVVDFIEAAASDERVLAIKQTLYRTSSDSPIVRALQRAADNGKQVTAVIELKARLDEERNILWARELEKAGVHVVFGFIGLKTHCKVALVVRREDDGIRRYVHLATGNYNPQTARIYTDLGCFTCNPDFCEDASALFNYLTGYCELPQWRKLVVAPSRHAVVHDREDRAGNAAATGGQGGPDHRQDQRPAGAGDRAGALPGQPGRREDRHDLPGHLLPAAGAARHQREHPRHVHRRSLSGAQPDFLFRQRRRSAGLHRLGRLDGPQPEPARGSGLSDRADGIEATADPRDPGHVAGGQHEGARAAAGRQLSPGGCRAWPAGKVRSQERFLELAVQAANRRSTDAVMPPIPFVEPRPRGTRRQRQQKMG